MGRPTANLPASSMGVYLGYVLPLAAPTVLGKGPFDIDPNEPVNSDGATRGNSDCWSVAGTSPLPFRFWTLEAMVGVSSISSVPSRGKPLIDISSPEREITDSKSAVSPDKTDPTRMSFLLGGPRFPAPGSLVNATFIVTVMSRSRVPMGFVGNQSASLMGRV